MFSHTVVAFIWFLARLSYLHTWLVKTCTQIFVLTQDNKLDKCTQTYWWNSHEPTCHFLKCFFFCGFQYLLTSCSAETPHQSTVSWTHAKSRHLHCWCGGSAVLKRIFLPLSRACGRLLKGNRKSINMKICQSEEKYSGSYFKGNNFSGDPDVVGAA